MQTVSRRWSAAVALGLGIALARPSIAAPLKLRPDVDVGEKRVALVIGNGGYQYATRLDQALRDAKMIANSLEAVGFEGQLLLDGSDAELRAAVKVFHAGLADGAFGFFYFAGHGIQVNGRNYLLPIDANLSEPGMVSSNTLDADQVMAAMEASGTELNVLVLDACRTNPFASQWTDPFKTSRFGLSLMNPNANDTLVAFATQPGATAADSGHYASELAQRLTAPCTSVAEVFGHVSERVHAATKGSTHPQRPWNQSTGVQVNQRQLGTCTDAERKLKEEALPPRTPAQRAPQPAPVAISPLGFELVWVESGTVWLGSPVDEPDRDPASEHPRRALVEGLYVMRTEVTQAVWRDVMGDDVAARVPVGSGNPRMRCDRYRRESLAGPNRPAICVSFDDAVQLANRLSERENLNPAYSAFNGGWRWNEDANGYRLLTEAEWMLAAKGTTEARRFAGAFDYRSVCTVGNLADLSAVKRFPSFSPHPTTRCDDGAAALAEVGSYDLHDEFADLTGNVWEWVWDHFTTTPNPDDQVDPKGPADGPTRTLKGGSWRAVPAFARLGARWHLPPDRRVDHVGVRLGRPANEGDS